MKIVILERDSVGSDVSMDCFRRFGEVTCYGNTTTVEEARQRTADADAVIANKAPLTRAALENAKNLKFIGILATGFDNCDLAFCRERGIRVTNVRNYSTAMVAQHTITLALAVSQKIVHYDRFVKSGAYCTHPSFSYFSETFSELEGKTWGIVGMGNIGSRVAKIASAFGCRVITHSLTGRTGGEYEAVDKETLLRECDILSLHCPLTELSRNFIDADALKKMKNTAILVNVARGPVVNNRDLYDALVAGEIAGAGLDVLEKEPMEPSNPLSRITDSSRLIITPHLAWASVEARTRCVEGIFLNLQAFLNGEARNVLC